MPRPGVTFRPRVERLEDRDVPSTVIYTDTYNWSGTGASATVALTVTEDAAGYSGQYLWDYQVTNTTVTGAALPDGGTTPGGLGIFGVSVGDPAAVENLGSSVGWASSIGTLTSDPNLVGWSGAGTSHPTLAANETADFWFTTAPTAVKLYTGLVATPGLAAQANGPAAAPAPALIVTTAQDVVDASDGQTSLREAIASANGVNNLAGVQRIGFKATLQGATITLDPNQGNPTDGFGQLVIKKNVFIDGAGLNITIQRDPRTNTLHRIFQVGTPTSTPSAKLTGLTLVNGKVSEAGGAVLSYGDLTVDNCYLIQNEATDSRGGAIADVARGKSLTITGSYFTGNTAYLGGAVYIDERVSTSITGGAFTLNTATQSGPTNDGSGGAIYIYSSTTTDPTNVTLSGVELSENTAAARGGAICVNNSGPGGTSLAVLGTYIHGNQALGAAGKGGGVYFGKGTLTLGGAVILGNAAVTGTDIYRLNTGTTLLLIPGTTNLYTDTTGP